MNKNLYDEDYIKGIKFLLQESKIQGVNIRKSQWVPNVSKMLSECNLCYKFWYNVWEQNRLSKIPLCETWFDIMYGCDKWLFMWSSTEEGDAFWKTHLWGMLGLGDSDFYSIRKLKDMRLQ